VAEDLGKLYYQVGVDTKDLTRAEREMEDFGTGARKAEKDVDSLGRGTKDATGKMSTGFGSAKTAIVGMIGAYAGFAAAKSAITGIISTTAEFSKSISNLSAITGATGKDLQFYSDQAKEIGKTTSLSASQAAEAFKLIASAKPDLLSSAASLAAVTKEAVTLAEAAGIGLPDAAKALGSALNQFQLPASDANRVINALAASSKLGAAEVTSVTEAMRNAGSTANSLGVSFEETVAGIQALAAAGIQGADAGTALRQVMLQLESSGNDNLRPSIVGLSGALENLSSEQLDTVQLMDLVGKEAFRAAASLLVQKDVVRDLTGAITGTNVATEQAATNMDNLSGDSKAAASAFEALQIAIGESFEPAMRSATQATTEFISGWADADRIGSAIDTIKTVAEALAVVLVARMIPAVVESGVAFSVSTGQSIAYQAALARMAGVSGTAAIATGVLRGAMGLVGGQVGVAAIASYGVYKLVDAYIDHNKEAERAAAVAMLVEGGFYDLGEEAAAYAEKVNKATQSLRGYIAAGGALSGMSAKMLKEQADRIAALNKEKTATDSVTGATASLSEEQQKAKDKTDGYIASLRNQIQVAGMTSRAAAIFNAVTGESIDLTAEQTSEVATLAAELFDLKEVTKKTTDKTEDLNKGLREQLTALEMTARAAAIYNAVIKLGTEATAEQIVEAATLTARIYDLGAAKDAATTAAAKLDAQNEKTTRNAQEKYNSMRDSLAGYFTDIALNGENAFEKIKQAAITTVARIVAEWAAVKALSFLGISSPGGGGGGGGIAGTVTSSVISAGVKSVAGSIFGGGTAAAGATATGGGLAGLGSSAVALATNPVTLAIVAAAVAAKLLDGGGTMSSNAGMLTQDLGHAGSFDIPAFASGADFTGFSRRSGQDDALGTINAFRDMDAQLTAQYIAKNGIAPNLKASDFIGYDETGSGRGAFFGNASEEGGGRGTPLQKQLEQFGARWLELAGIDGSHANGLNRVPFDGYIAELHQGERVSTESEANAQDSMMGGMMTELRRIAESVKRTADTLTRVTRDGDALLTEPLT